MSDFPVIPRLHAGIHPTLKSMAFSIRVAPFSVRTIDFAHIGDTHWHDYTQLWYTVSGTYDQVINGKRIRQDPGSLSLIFPFTIHNIAVPHYDSKRTQIICVSIFEDLFSKNIMPFRTLSYVTSVFDKLILSPLIKLSGKEKERMDELFSDCLAEYNRHNEMQERRIFNNISNIFELLANNRNAEISEAKLNRAHEQSLAISEAARFITANSMGNISLEEVSGLVSMSKRSFNDKFKSCTGQNFHEFYMRSRLRRVLSYLRHSDKSISEIAEMFGFYDSVHLSHTIKSIYGVSATELRLNMLLRSKTYGEFFHEHRMKHIGWMNLSPEKIDYMYRGSIGEPVY